MTASIRGSSAGGWLRSASMTPTIGGLRRLEAVDDGGAEPELAAAVDTVIRWLRASSSASAPVPSGELSSTMISSPSRPALR